MMIFRTTTKIATILALLAIAGFFIYKGIAGPMKIITTGTASVKINAPQANKLTSGLVGYWTFDGQDTNWGTNTTNDRSGQGNNGAMTNMSITTSPVPGVAGQALNFDRTDDYINTSNNQNLDMTGNMTISAWIYSKGSSNNQTIVLKAFCDLEFPDGGIPYVFSVTPINKMNYQSGDSNSTLCLGGYSSDITSSDSISLNQWQHIVLVRNSSQLKVTFYLNSLQDSGGWQTYSAPGGGGTLRIGSFVVDSSVSGPGPSNFFNGAIDEVRIYNRALSAAEIAELYNQGQAKINVSQAGKLTNGLVGHWTFDGQDTNWGTNTTNDRSGQGNNGAMTNMSTTTSPVPGVAGQALYFDGINDKISIPSSSSLSITGPITIEAWVYPVELSSVVKNIVCRTSQYDLHIMPNSGSRPNSVMFVGGNGNVDTSGNVLTRNEWNHIVAVFSGVSNDPVNSTNAKTYINSVLKSDAYSNYWNTTSSSSSVYIGANCNGNASFFNGGIDEVRIYDRALSQSEITELYNMGR